MFGKKRGKNGKCPGPPVHDDLVRRDVTADDVAIKDAFSGRILGYSIDSRRKARLAVNALDSAVSRRGDAAGCIVYSERGSQFRSR